MKNTRNIKVCISYDGSNYHGFQRQKDKVTIQGEIEKAVLRLIGENTVINGCSRTDAGVHAKQYYFNAHIESKIPCIGFVKGMNSLLPNDICVNSCEDADNDFHARFNTVFKEYIYILNTAEIRNPFNSKYSHHYPYKTDVKLMNEAAKLLIGNHDFGAFCRSDGKKDGKSTVRTIFDFDVFEEDNKVTFRVSADGFLYNMVRILVGTLIYVNESKITFADIENLINSKDRTMAGVTVPAQGLYLNKVKYCN